MGTPDTPNVQSLVRGLAVIRTFNADRPRQTLAQVADATGLARATARRFLHTLVTVGYAGTDGAEFWLTPRVLELGYSYLSGLGLPATSASPPPCPSSTATTSSTSTGCRCAAS